MQERTKRKTGEIIPRDYGIRLDLPGKDLFIPPSSYVLAQLALETPIEIRTRIADFAERNNLGKTRLEREFKEAVRKREGSLNILNFSRRTKTRRTNTVFKIRREATRFTGTVKSKEEGEYEFSLPLPNSRSEINMGYPDARATTEDNLYNEGKGRMAVIGFHLAIPEIAIYHDSKSNISQNNNMTGLYPSQRNTGRRLPELPFSFHDFDYPNSELTDLIMAYYLDDLSQFELSKRVIANQALFSRELTKAISSPLDLALFKVIRQKEREIGIEKGSLESRRLGSITTILDNLEDYFKSQGYYPAGYSREFAGTEWETIARRFEPRKHGPIYSIVVGEHPPLIVKRNLGDKRPFEVLESDIPPENRVGWYKSIDDVTRRDSITEVILPDLKLESAGYKVSQTLKQEYESLRNN